MKIKLKDKVLRVRHIINGNEFVSSFISEDNKLITLNNKDILAIKMNDGKVIYPNKESVDNS